MACDADFRLIKSAVSVYEAVAESMNSYALRQVDNGSILTIHPACLLQALVQQSADVKASVSAEPACVGKQSAHPCTYQWVGG